MTTAGTCGGVAVFRHIGPKTATYENLWITQIALTRVNTLQVLFTYAREAASRSMWRKTATFATSVPTVDGRPR